MDKIGLDIIGLSYSQTQSGAYALVLGEKNGKRRLPIIIGGFEAQAIAIELEKMRPTRPLTHDLFKTFAGTFNIKLKEVLIYNLKEGIFFAKLICEMDKEIHEIDARTSDAIALAVRFKSPIFTHEFILSSAGIILDEEEEKISDIESDEEIEDAVEEVTKPKDIKDLSISELNEALDKAIAEENYEKASVLRDEITKRSSSEN